MKKETIALAAALVFLAGTAWANVYKNPVHPFGEGRYGAGASLDTMNRDFESEGLGDFDVDISRLDFNFNIGVGDRGAIELTAGAVSVDNDESFSGTEGGLRYRHNLDEPGSSAQFRKGFFISYRTGYLEASDTDDDFEFWQWDVGFGGAIRLQENADLYVGGVFSEATVDVYTVQFGDTRTADSADILGGFAGIEFAPSDQLVAGAELHVLHETGFGAYLDFRF